MKMSSSYFFAALTLAHLALFAALIRARPAAEMWRLGAMETTFRPRVRAQRALCAAEILARAASLIVRRPRVAPCAVHSAERLNRSIQCVYLLCCLVAFSLQLRDYVHVSPPGEDCSRYQKLRGSLH
jgi:hypothetical protein